MHPVSNRSSIIISVCFQKQNIRFIEHYSHTFIQKICFEVLLYVRLYGVDAKLNKTIPLLQELTVLKGNHAYTLATTILPLSILHPLPDPSPPVIPELQGTGGGGKGHFGGKDEGVTMQVLSFPLQPLGLAYTAHNIPELPSATKLRLETVSPDLTSADSCIQLMLTLLPEYPLGPSSSESGKYCVSPPPPATPPQLVSAMACFLAGAAPWSRTPTPLKLLKTPFQPQLKQHLLYKSHSELETRVRGFLSTGKGPCPNFC